VSRSVGIAAGAWPSRTDQTSIPVFSLNDFFPAPVIAGAGLSILGICADRFVLRGELADQDIVGIEGEPNTAVRHDVSDGHRAIAHSQGVMSVAGNSGWEIAGNLLMRHVRFSPQLGEKPCSIKAARWTHAPQQLDDRHERATP
jgi:hypothetical protein